MHFLFVQLEDLTQIPAEQGQIAHKWVIICKSMRDAAGWDAAIVWRRWKEKKARTTDVKNIDRIMGFYFMIEWHRKNKSYKEGGKLLDMCKNR